MKITFRGLKKALTDKKTTLIYVQYNKVIVKSANLGKRS